MLNAATQRAAQDGLRLNCSTVGFSNAEGVGMCVGVVNNDAIPGVLNTGAAVVNDDITATCAVRTCAAGSLA